MKITVKDFCYTCERDWGRFSSFVSVRCGGKTSFIYKTFGVGGYDYSPKSVYDEHCESCSTKLFDIKEFKIPKEKMKDFVFQYIKYLSNGENHEN